MPLSVDAQRKRINHAIFKAAISGDLEKILKDAVRATWPPAEIVVSGKIGRFCLRRVVPPLLQYGLGLALINTESYTDVQRRVRWPLEVYFGLQGTSVDYRNLAYLNADQGNMLVGPHWGIMSDTIFVKKAYMAHEMNPPASVFGDNLAQNDWITGFFKITDCLCVPRRPKRGDLDNETYRAVLDQYRAAYQNTYDNVFQRRKRGHPVMIAQGNGRNKSGIIHTDPEVIARVCLASGAQDKLAVPADKINTITFTGFQVIYEWIPEDRAIATQQVTGKKKPNADMKAMAHELYGYKGKVEVYFTKPLVATQPMSVKDIAQSLDQSVLTELRPTAVQLAAYCMLYEKRNEYGALAREQQAIIPKRKFNALLRRLSSIQGAQVEEITDATLALYATQVHQQAELLGTLPWER